MQVHFYCKYRQSYTNDKNFNDTNLKFTSFFIPVSSHESNNFARLQFIEFTESPGTQGDNFEKSEKLYPSAMYLKGSKASHQY